MRQPVLVRAVGGVLAVSPAALAATALLTGSFSGGEQFIAEPGYIATWSFPVAVDHKCAARITSCVTRRASR